MQHLDVKFAVGFQGKAVGTPTNTELNTPLIRVARCQPSGTTKQVYDRYQLPIGITSTVQLNLISGLSNPLGEAITGTVAFTQVLGVHIEHDPSSPATSGVKFFNGGTSEFQGPLSPTAEYPAMLPGQWQAFGMPATATGWTVNSTACRIDLQNLDTTQTALVNVFVVGKAG